MIRRVRMLLVVLAPLTLGGCVAMLNSAMEGLYPTYPATMKAAPPIPSGSGRMVLYVPKNSVGEDVTYGALAGVNVQVDKTYKADVREGTFVYLDLPAGSHTLISRNRFRFAPLLTATDQTSTWTVEAGKTIFVNVKGTSAKTDPVLVASNQAQPQLADLHDHFKNTLPLNKQP